MKVVFVTGNHPRHAYIARKLYDAGLLSGLIVEQRENFIPQAPVGLSKELEELFDYHFSERERVEHIFFSVANWPDVETLYVTKDELNGNLVHEFLKKFNFNMMISYGCHMIGNDTLNLVNGECWNCHGGLSPQYKGAITHFWPSYMLEPQMTGMTIHTLTSRLDAGDIVHQCASDLVRGDTLHMLAARSVIKLGDHLPKVIKKHFENGGVEKLPQKGNGMLWLASRWKPEHLNVIYKIYEDKIVDKYLDGEITNIDPELFTQF